MDSGWSWLRILSVFHGQVFRHIRQRRCAGPARPAGRLWAAQLCQRGQQVLAAVEVYMFIVIFSIEVLPAVGECSC